MEVVQCLVALVVVLILGQFLRLKLVARRLPPGPSPLPIVGNLWTLKFVLCHETLMQLAKTYGNTMTLWMGMVPVVVFNGYEAVRDMLVANSDETSARPLTPYVLEFGKERGILTSNGHTWKQQGRFSALMLRSLGVGKKSMENRVQEEAQHLVDLFASQEGRPIDPKSPVMSSLTNVIAAVVFGHRFSYDDPVLHKLLEGINLVSPFMYSICGQTKDEQNSTYDEANMVQVGLDLFVAGSDTTTVTLLWALLYMGKYPHIKEKVQLELGNVIENYEIIQYEHHKKLPYTYAVINETLRYSSIAALGLPRECAKDTTIQGFPIKKGTCLLYNLFSVLHDHNHWEKPEEFDSSRFLDEDGNFVKKETLIPFAAVLLILQFVRLRNAATSLPPGPTPLPILGNLWTLNFTLHHGTLMQLAKKYGNTFTVWAGHSPIVVFNGYQAVRDMLVSNAEATSGRPMTPALRSYSKERGVIIVNDHIWKQHRRFVAATLRHLLLGKNSLQLQIQEEAKLLLEEFTSHGGRPVDPCQLIEVSVANVISFLVFGHRLPSNDDSAMRLTKFTSTISHFLNSQLSQLYNAFPWLMNHLPGPHQRYFAQMENFYNYARCQIKHHQQTNNVEPHTLVDFYMTEISKAKDDPESTFDEDNMIQVVTDFFVAGTHTAVETLLWALLYLVAQPDIQEKVHSELDGVLEPSHAIQYDDHKRLPYTNAVIHEVRRLSCVLPMALPHLCLKNTTIQGFPIQKGTVLLANLISVNLDPKHWETPDQFNPHHFLDKDRQFVKKEAFLPFSAGYRTCLGDQLARVQLFQFFSNLLRQFSFKLPDGIKEVDLEPVCDLSLRPKTYQICAVSRDYAHG